MLRFGTQLCRQASCTKLGVSGMPVFRNSLQLVNRKMTQQRPPVDFTTSIRIKSAKDNEKITALGWFLLVSEN